MLDPHALEAACIAHLKWIAMSRSIETGRIVNAASMDEHRSFLRKHPEVKDEVSETVSAYLAALKPDQPNT
jgi:hypothetical protein